MSKYTNRQVAEKFELWQEYFGNNIFDSVREHEVDSVLVPNTFISLLHMLEFYADSFVKTMSLLAKLTEHYQFSAREHEPIKSDDLLPWLLELKRTFLEMHLTFAVMKLNGLMDLINVERAITRLEFRHQLEELEARIHDELKLRTFFSVSTVEDSFYKTPYLFGERVYDNFPSANFDIEEAGKCFALARYTACVMHLQRVVEVGLKAYGCYLGISLNNPNWGNVLRNAQNEINTRNDASTWRTTIEKEFCEKLQPLLHSVRVAWRNPSMHADAKYTEQEAKEIFESVKGVMRNIAEHLNEKGKFSKRKKQ